jgi:hypothetical protein
MCRLFLANREKERIFALRARESCAAEGRRLRLMQSSGRKRFVYSALAFSPTAGQVEDFFRIIGLTTRRRVGVEAEAPEMISVIGLKLGHIRNWSVEISSILFSAKTAAMEFRVPINYSNRPADCM